MIDVLTPICMLFQVVDRLGYSLCIHKCAFCPHVFAKNSLCKQQYNSGAYVQQKNKLSRILCTTILFTSLIISQGI